MTDLLLQRGLRLNFDDGPLIMGVVNANTDSFSDPRSDSSPQLVIDHAAS